MMLIAIIIVIVLLLLWMLLTKRNVFKDYYYFDANSTTPIHPGALSALCNAAYLGNASTEYAKTTGAAAVIRNTSSIIQNWCGDEGYEIIYNSGASEGNNYILQVLSGIDVPHYILSSIEHKTSLECVRALEQAGKIQLTLIDPDLYGIINPNQVLSSIRPNTRLISIMHVNNEIGSINDITTIGQIASTAGIFFHSDTAQSFGKYPINMAQASLDAITVSFHKLYGPIGVGALIMSKRLMEYIKSNPNPIGIYGSQNMGFRGGTLNTPGIAAAGAAMNMTFKDRVQKNNALLSLKYQLISELSKTFPLVPLKMFLTTGSDEYIPPSDMLSGASIGMVILGPTNSNGYPDPHIVSPNTLLIAFPKFGKYPMTERICNIKIKQYLFQHGIIVSISSACNTELPGPSHVLMAIKAPYIIRSSVLRISFIDNTKPSDVSYLAAMLIKAVNIQS